MCYKTITKEIFDSYIGNDSDSVLEGVLTNNFGTLLFGALCAFLWLRESIMSKPSTRRAPSLSLWLWA